jgi:hypothetical protein
MTARKTKNQPTDAFLPLPWDEEPLVSRSLCLEAIDNGDMRVPARYLREAEVIDRRILMALADLLDPPVGKRWRYVLKQAHGRPRQKRSSSAELVLALTNQDLKSICAPSPQCLSAR